MATVNAPMPIAAPAIMGQAGKVRQRDSARGADEHAWEDRAAAEPAQGQRIGEALADDEQYERADGPGPGLVDERGERVLS